MDKKTVTLPTEVWDRIITILDLRFRNDPDTEYVLQQLYMQLHFTPADEPTIFVPHKDIPTKLIPLKQ